MQVMKIDRPGGPEQMHLEELPTPTPGPGEVRIKVAAAGVNFIDIYYRTGLYPQAMPYALGLEGAGTVEALGPGVQEFSIGDRVAWKEQVGSYATQVLTKPERLVSIPSGVAFEEAAAVMLQGMTAHYLAHDSYPLKPGDTCLVHAAAGGVGLLLCQIAKMRGARVIGTVSTEEKARLARRAGADEVILYTKEDFVAACRGLTGGEGVAVIYDGVGKETFLPGFNAIKVRGSMVLYGQSSGSVAPIDPLLLNTKGALTLTRPSLGHFTRTHQEFMARAKDLFSWIAQKKLFIEIGKTYPLAEAARAHQDLSARTTVGKLLLLP